MAEARPNHLKSVSLYASHGTAASLLPIAYEHGNPWQVRVAAIVGVVMLPGVHYLTRCLKQTGNSALWHFLAWGCKFLVTGPRGWRSSAPPSAPTPKQNSRST